MSFVFLLNNQCEGREDCLEPQPLRCEHRGASVLRSVWCFSRVAWRFSSSAGRLSHREPAVVTSGNTEALLVGVGRVCEGRGRQHGIRCVLRRSARCTHRILTRSLGARAPSSEALNENVPRCPLVSRLSKLRPDTRMAAWHGPPVTATGHSTACASCGLRKSYAARTLTRVITMPFIDRCERARARKTRGSAPSARLHRQRAARRAEWTNISGQSVGLCCAAS